MSSLALLYYVCKKSVAHEGVRGNVQELFQEQSKYNEVFNESAINKELSGNHVALNYVLVWMLDQILLRVDLPQRDNDYWKYTRWYVLPDVYWKVLQWKQSDFEDTSQVWVSFIGSDWFVGAVEKQSRSCSGLHER